MSIDTNINFNWAIEIYQIRWIIEVLFKEFKQYLNLLKAQNTNFNGQIANTALALTTYTILSLVKRFGSYETIRSLFRANKQDMLKRTICERKIEVILSLIM
ncbi:MAG TPA: transposase [Dysgonamonadaceae bacterium]|nr:transposase [Dysgonamonadaceae bacterium]